MKNAFTIVLASALITTARDQGRARFGRSAGRRDQRQPGADRRPRPRQRRRPPRSSTCGWPAPRREVCGTASDVDLNGKNEVRQCRDDMLAKARAKRDAVLAAAAASKGFIAVTAAR